MFEYIKAETPETLQLTLPPQHTCIAFNRKPLHSAPTVHSSPIDHFLSHFETQNTIFPHVGQLI